MQLIPKLTSSAANRTAAFRPLAMPAALAMIVAVFLLWLSPCASAAGQGGADLSNIVNDARHGNFSQVLALLEKYPHSVYENRIDHLTNDLSRYLNDQKQNLQKRQTAYHSALTKAAKALAKGDIEQSLTEMILAEKLALSRKNLLTSPIARDVTGQATAAARSAASQGRWVKALELYQLLNNLHKVSAKYLTDMKNAQHHVQVIKIFAPVQLEKIYRQQVKQQKRQNNNKSSHLISPDKSRIAQEAKAIHLDQEPWQVRLEEINFDMLRQILNGAATKHIASKGYKPVLLGAIDQLRIMVNTPQVVSVFPGLGDVQNRRRFSAYLNSTFQKLQHSGAVDASQAESIVSDIRDKNKQTVNLPSVVIAYQLAQGATGTLDRFSRVIWPSQLILFSRTMSGSFSGVGITVSLRNGKITVISPLYGTPAANAGVLAGDVIVKVNGQRTIGWSMDHAIRKITGPIGSDVTLSLTRSGHKKLINVTLKRQKIAIKSVLGWRHTQKGAWNYWIAPQQRIGYIQLTQFIPQTARDLDQAINQMQSSGPIGGLILDLRYNPGGLLSSAGAVADRFIAQGPLVFTVDAKRHHQSVLDAHQGDTYAHFPVVVLINGGTASAAEIVTGALQDYARALVVGTRSFGKGSVQDLFPVDRGKAYFKLTTQHYMLPLGQIIHRFPGAKQWGITPDITISMTPKQMTKALHFRQRADILPGAQTTGAKPIPNPAVILKKGLDPQLQAALLYLKTKRLARQMATVGMARNAVTSAYKAAQ